MLKEELKEDGHVGEWMDISTGKCSLNISVTSRCKLQRCCANIKSAGQQKEKNKKMRRGWARERKENVGKMDEEVETS